MIMREKERDRSRERERDRSPMIPRDGQPHARPPDRPPGDVGCESGTPMLIPEQPPAVKSQLEEVLVENIS